MRIIETVREIRELSRTFRLQNKRIGFVPTMGALHEGHLSLVRRSVDDNDATIVSIFVNPAQFGPQEDYHAYPRDLGTDLKKLSPFHVDAVFAPDVGEMFGGGDISVDVGRAGRILCGIARPAHFNAVATVVAKLFNIVFPERAYFGQKDFQQTVVVRRLVSSLHFDVDIIVCPTLRDKYGLALSSRNSYLSQKDRLSARVLFRALKHGEKLILMGGEQNAARVRKEIKEMIHTEPAVIPEYIETVDPGTLDHIEKITGSVLIALAVRINKTRLIDNIFVEKD